MILAAAVVAAVLILAMLVLFAARVRPRPVVARSAGGDTWTDGAGNDLAGLSESERCDVAFAIGALDDDASRPLLERALEDSSEAVALAAAHALARRGNADCVERYFAANPGERASRISATLALLASSA